MQSCLKRTTTFHSQELLLIFKKNLLRNNEGLSVLKIKICQCIIHLYTNKIALYFTLLKTIHWNSCIVVKVLKILRHVSVSSWPSSGRYLISLRQLLKINFLGLWKHACCTCCVLCCCTATTKLGRVRRINTKHNKYNRHASTDLKSLSLVTDIKKINISLRMVRNWPKYVGEFLGLLNNTSILMWFF